MPGRLTGLKGRRAADGVSGVRDGVTGRRRCCRRHGGGACGVATSAHCGIGINGCFAESARGLVRDQKRVDPGTNSGGQTAGTIEIGCALGSLGAFKRLEKDFLEVRYVFAHHDSLVNDPYRRSSQLQCSVSGSRAPFFSRQSRRRVVEGIIKPGAGEGPIAVGGSPGDAERPGSFFEREAGEDAELRRRLGTVRVDRGQASDGVVKGDEIIVGRVNGDRVKLKASTCKRLVPSKCLTRLRSRARSMRMRRMASAAAAKKWRRPSHGLPGSEPTSLKYASWTSAVAWSVLAWVPRRRPRARRPASAVPLVKYTSGQQLLGRPGLPSLDAFEHLRHSVARGRGIDRRASHDSPTARFEYSVGGDSRRP